MLEGDAFQFFMVVFQISSLNLNYAMRIMRKFKSLFIMENTHSGALLVKGKL